MQRRGGPVLIYAATILVSAFLLFQVQPLIAKIILPWFGGSAAVWAAVLLFFQVVLLAGYAYAHLLIRRFAPRVQMIVHAALLAGSCALLPILPSSSWKPTGPADPTLRILLLLGATVGLPYFLLSSTSPLLQAWYVRRTGNPVPYRLFALSNLGSLVGLLSFPLLVEPAIASRGQAYGWSGIYVAFAVLCVATAWVSRRAVLPEGMLPIQGASDDAPLEPQPEEPDEPRPVPEPSTAPEQPKRPGIRDYALWIALAAVASTLLVAVTTHLTQNVAPIPLLWVVPLALYLLTFIFAFEGDRIYRREVFVPLLTPALALMAYFVFNKNITIAWLVPTFTIGMFVCCMVCHGELATRRPGAEHLTAFYLMVSVGGAVGGVFVAIVAPVVFDSYLELPIGMIACAVLAFAVLRNVEIPWLKGDTLGMLLFFGVCATAGFLVREQVQGARSDQVLARNFYGALSVVDETDDQGTVVRRLYHGTIEHGSQLLDEARRGTPTSYYGEEAGIGRAIRALQDEHDELRVGIVGLGAGVLATYGRDDDSFTYYEINPAVVELARTRFSFYADSGAEQRIELGDGRLTLERSAPQKFDLLVIDAFSGDAIPVHLLTAEAFDVYERHLARDGVLAIHVSNRYLDLVPVVARGAQGLDRTATVVTDTGGSAYTEDSDWVLVTRDQDLVRADAFDDAQTTEATAPDGFRAWTDDYSNIVRILKLRG
jgi:spermidine synthase